ncbi:hypothetical protein V5T82_09880 [Magnetovibrio sp. PR-2]|uniref:hypothetical protein n=1 Tax=Magnetovibrio sp. PR-2 TaxID=3120356 RepID=UPI002FCE2219
MSAKQILRAKALGLMTLAALSVSACNANIMIPELDLGQKKKMNESRFAFTRTTIYGDALDTLGNQINNNVDYMTVVQSKPIGNTAGGGELPVDVTNMVASSVNRMAGQRLVYVGYDPSYYQNELNTGNANMNRVLPNVVIAGSITEYDKDVETKNSGFNVDIILGGGGGETDAGGEVADSESFTRVTIDLHLLDYATQAYVPGIQATNTIYVYEVRGSNQLGFLVYGSGVGGNGRLKTSQGLHQAVRNLVELSVLELMGKYYDLPYWRGFGSAKADPNIMKSMMKSFGQKSNASKVMEIQRLLTKYDLGPIRVRGKTYKAIKPDGVMGRVTKAFINSFLDQHNLASVRSDDLDTLYAELISNQPLG